MDALSRAIAIIKEFEGCELQAYPDPGTGGIPWTIGYGTTRYPNGQSVRSTDTITLAQAEEYLQHDLTRQFIPTLARTIPKWATLNPNQQAALISFAYNLGAGFYGSAGFNTISHVLREQHWNKIESAFGLYVRGGSGPLPGLVRRRQAEAKLFLTPVSNQPVTTLPTAIKPMSSTLSKILGYLPQPDVYTCQSACIAKMIGSTAVGAVRAALESIGEPGNPYVMGEYLKSRVAAYEFIPDASLNDAKAALSDGAQCITHGWFTPSGHVISLVGWEPDSRTQSYRFVVDDPWYEFDFKNGTYTRNSGDNVRYSSYGLYAYCVASSSYSHAKQLYRQGRLLSSEKNMWLHVIRN